MLDVKCILIKMIIDSKLKCGWAVICNKTDLQRRFKIAEHEKVCISYKGNKN